MVELQDKSVYAKDLKMIRVFAKHQLRSKVYELKTYALKYMNDDKSAHKMATKLVKKYLVKIISRHSEEVINASCTQTTKLKKNSKKIEEITRYCKKKIKIMLQIDKKKVCKCHVILII